MKHRSFTIRKSIPIIGLLSFGLLWPGYLKAQRQWFDIGYAHNDYLQKKPLFDALENGYTHIEVDIFLQKDSLIVAHWFPFFKGQTLEGMYLAPLKRYLESQQLGSFIPPITLVIDIKSSPKETYNALLVLLEKYRSMLSINENGVFRQGAINVVLTGRKPTDLIANQTRRLVMLDDHLDRLSMLPNKNLFKMASCKYTHVLRWSGRGLFPAKDRYRLMKMVAAAHSQGKKVRLWACPENAVVWKALLDCGVDYINTDQLVKLKEFSRSRDAQFQAQLER